MTRRCAFFKMGITLAVFKEAGIEFVEKTNLNKAHNGLTRLYINFLTTKVVKPSGSYALLTCLQYLSVLRHKISLNEFEYDDHAPAIPVVELVTCMSLWMPPATAESKINLLHGGKWTSKLCQNCLWLPRECCAVQRPAHRVSEYSALLELQYPNVALLFTRTLWRARLAYTVTSRAGLHCEGPGWPTLWRAGL